MIDQLIHVNGVGLPIRDTGSGSPVLALHGALSDLRAWEPIRTQLGATVRFIAITQRYHGTEPWRDDGAAYGRDTHVADLIALIEAMNLAPVHLLAWSYGGDVGLNAIFQRPDLFASAILFEPSLSGLMSSPEERASERRLVDELRTLPLKSGHDTPERLAAAFLRTLNDGDSPTLDGVHNGLIQDMIQDNARSVPLFCRQTGNPGLTPDDLARIRLPATVLRGSRSVQRYRCLSATITRHLDAAQLREVEGGTHMAPLAVPVRITDLILAHLSKISGRTPRTAQPASA